MNFPAAKRLAAFMTQFPGVDLLPGFHVHWPETVHIPLNQGLDPFREDGRTDPEYFEEVSRRAVRVLEKEMGPEDELLLVLNGYPGRPGVIPKYLKHPELKYRMDSRQTIWPDGEDRIPVTRLILPCRAEDIRWRPLLLAISGQDFGRHPQLRKAGSVYPPDVFVLNETKRTIFHMYDDRGCDLSRVERRC
ncbi:hypothetical protein ACFFIY_05960 [Bhargavaea ullalensis]|uniref:DUF3885 domain-containing protein n=1 Tax=Bhargavaea ullalensis TaxID=1265685 RepID=A0ABV2GBB8_9BACL